MMFCVKIFIKKNSFISPPDNEIDNDYFDSIEDLAQDVLAESSELSSDNINILDQDSITLRTSNADNDNDNGAGGANFDDDSFMQF